MFCLYSLPISSSPFHCVSLLLCLSIFSRVSPNPPRSVSHSHFLRPPPPSTHTHTHTHKHTSTQAHKHIHILGHAIYPHKHPFPLMPVRSTDGWYSEGGREGGREGAALSRSLYHLSYLSLSLSPPPPLTPPLPLLSLILLLSLTRSLSLAFFPSPHPSAGAALISFLYAGRLAWVTPAGHSGQRPMQVTVGHGEA